jgi:carbamoyltransferase
MYILGIWDGHDSGAALIEGSRIVFAANEERFTRNKLEVAFPNHSIREALKFAGLAPADIGVVAISTSDFSKTLTRVFPSLKRRFYQIRRRKVEPSPFNRFSKKAKYILTEIRPNAPTRWISSLIVRRCLKKVGFRGYRLLWVDHHLAHVAAAVCTNPFDKGLFLSLDGIGDGLSGMIGSFDSGRISIMRKYRGRDSFGIFFEHVTNLLNMRELEDEGKVMALASFGYPIPDDQNPLLSLFKVDGLNLKAKYHSTRLYRRLGRLMYLYPSEQFAYMAQRVLEIRIPELVRNAQAVTGFRHLAYVGGVASNVKVNMLLKNSENLDDVYVFPHMGDGGLALGAAIYVNLIQNRIVKYKLDNLFFGPSYTTTEIEREITKFEVCFKRFDSIEDKVAQLIKDGQIVLWFQGRMEYGPRALGNRSILALPNSMALKNKLNIYLKKRVWYQPFCPSMMEEDAAEILADHNRINNRFMTIGYIVKEKFANNMIAVINADNSCRPQILGSSEGPEFVRYMNLLKKLKVLTGFGVVLNTSLNKHGEPIINTPKEALQLLVNSQFQYLVLEDYLIWKEPSTS